MSQRKGRQGNKGGDGKISSLPQTVLSPEWALVRHGLGARERRPCLLMRIPKHGFHCVPVSSLQCKRMGVKKLTGTAETGESSDLILGRFRDNALGNSLAAFETDLKTDLKSG